MNEPKEQRTAFEMWSSYCLKANQTRQ